jgi:glycyl-tRNA synthetase beta chain
MVGEFPELQGVMGRYYALNDDEDPRVADAIAEHYKPAGPGDTCPRSPESIAVALADKIDALVGFFGIGEKPTGSRDPFALRRAALGTLRIILENGLRLSLRSTFTHAAKAYGFDFSGLASELLFFLSDRLRTHLRDEGVRHDLIAAVFAVGIRSGSGTVAESDFTRLMRRVEALERFLSSGDGENLIMAYRRASNIVAIESRKGGWSEGGVLQERFRQPEETTLDVRLRAVGQTARDALGQESFAAAMEALATLRRPVDEFFDKVTVNADDPALRENRLRLLSRIRAVMNQVADFSQIEG